MSDEFSASPLSASGNNASRETESVAPTNTERDRRLRIAEVEVLGLPARHEAATEGLGYTPPTAIELARRISVLEAKLGTKP